MISAQGFFPGITLPTRFSEHRGTLIDNFLCKLTEGSLNSTSGILINQISDHLPCFICMDCILTRDMVPKFITITQKSPDSLNKFRLELIHSNIYDKLNKNIDGNPKENYNILEEIILNTMIKCLPTKTIKYNKHKYKKSSWIIQGSITFRDKLYLKIKITTIDTARYQVPKTNLHAYNKILKKIFVWPNKYILNRDLRNIRTILKNMVNY